MGADRTPMVLVSGAYKSYGQDVVLNNLNMTVPTGTIYGLLGPSGCGKTVLLNCILGNRPLDGGYVKLGVNRKSEVGYMPQEIGLFKEFTMKETFVFYGRMFGLDFKAVKKRCKALTKVLDLPDWRSRIGSLSGGEQRRVSLAVALLHDPKLLLLDEPTVGVDPILSRNIWEFLERATRSGVTVIVTTHYVEEAKMAHVVGLMREGELLVEDSPSNVMSSQNAETLESAFLQLSKLHQSKVQVRGKEPLRPHKNLKVKVLQQDTIFSWDRFVAQLVKNFIWMKRNTTIIGLLLLLPAMQSFLFCLSFGHNPTDIKVAVVADELVSDDGSDVCFNDKGYYEVDDFNCTITTPFSCYLVELFKMSTDAIVYSNEDDAVAAVRANKVWAMLHIPSNFSSAITELALRGFSFLEDESRNQALEQVAIDVHMDSSNYIMNQILRKSIIDRFGQFLRDLVKSCGFPESYGSPPVRFMDPVFGSKDPVFAEGGLPGFLCSFCFFFTLLFTSGSLMMEKLVGLLDRSFVAGMTYFEIVSAHLVIQGALIVLQKTIMLLVVYVIFEHPFLGNAALLVALLFAIELVGVATGFLITELFTSDRLVTYAVIGATLSVFCLGVPMLIVHKPSKSVLKVGVMAGLGIVWPLEGAHAFLREAVWAFPVSPAVESYKSITLRGHGLENSIVLRGFVSCFVWIAALSLATVAVNKARRSLQIL